jgi:uncharacterized membrane protein YdjX (TVP38/TMEM64 family)
VVGLVIAVVAAGRLGLVGFVRDAERLEEFLTGSGPLGPIAYVLAFTAVQPISLPGGVLIVPATLVWPGLTVFLLSWLGGMIASTVGFVVARWIARDWVQARLPDGLRSWDDRIASRGVRAIIGLRLVTGYAPAADWLLGVSAVTVRQFLIGTAVGLVPATAAFAFLGDDAIRLFERLPAVGAALVGVAALVVVLARRRRAVDQPSSTDSSIGGPPS